MVRTEVLRQGFTPVYLDTFPKEWEACWILMEHHLSRSALVIHLAGMTYGGEPAHRPAAEARRSHAQLEFALARSLGKPVHPLVFASEFPFDPCPDEPDDLQALQEAHRERLIRHHGSEIWVRTAVGLRDQIQSLRERLAEMVSAPPLGSPPAADPAPAPAPVTPRSPAPPAPANIALPWHPPAAAADFVGRSLEKETLMEALRNERRVAVCGVRGIGKSALIAAALTEMGPGPDAPGPFKGGIVSYNFEISPGYHAALAAILAQAGFEDLADTRHEAATLQLLARSDVCLVLEGCQAADSVDRVLALASGCYVVIEGQEPTSHAHLPTVHLRQLSPEDSAFLLYRARLSAEASPSEAAVAATAAAAVLPPLESSVWLQLATRLGAHPLILKMMAHRLSADQASPDTLVGHLERSGINYFDTLNHEPTGVPRVFVSYTSEFARVDQRALPAWYALSLHADAPAPESVLAAALDIPHEEVEAHLELLIRWHFVKGYEIPSPDTPAPERGWKLTSRALAESARLQWEWRDPIQQNPLFEPRAVYRRWRDWGLSYLHTCWKTRSVVGGAARYRLLEPHLHALLASIERNEGASSPNLLAALRWLSALHRLMGRFAAAQPLSERLVSLSESLYGPEHPETLNSLNNLATLHYRKGDLSAAEPLYRQSLALREKILGSEHPDTLSSKNNMANVLADRGDVRGAEALYRTTLTARQQVLGTTHQDTLVSAKNLANLLLDKGEFAEAEPLYRDTLDQQRKVLGPHHPDTAMTAYNYARLCVQLRRLPEAVSLASQAVEAARTIFAEGHPHRQRYEQLLARLNPQTAARN
jgi:tetratricopeptide (TPR) repeat protein